jgi:hypothetical protein
MEDPLYKIETMSITVRLFFAYIWKWNVNWVCYIKSILANYANEYKNQKRGGQHIILMDPTFLTLPTYQICIILMDLALLIVLAKQIRTIHN